MSYYRILFFAFFATLLFSCSEEKEKQEEIPAESFRNEVAATEVQVALAETKSFDYLINATGKLEAAAQVKAIIEQPGYLIELSIREGQTVSKGDVIARLDPIEAQIRLEKANIALKNAQAAFENDKLGFQRDFESGDPERIQFLENQLKAKNGVLLAEIELKEAQLNLDRCEVKAPISGKIADLKFKEGSLISSNTELCEILSTNSLDLKVKVLESDISLISLNQKAEVYPISNTQTALEGRVTGINPKVDENGLVQVAIRLTSSQNLLPGMNARAVIRAPQSNSLVVPKDAVVYRSGRAVVFTIENNESKWNYVEVGKDNGKEIEVLEGINPGSTVITTNNLQLAHQAPVQIVTD
ncbi:efflux RND transporter periplasmic adaptor subunit [Algoriphagus sp. CAU 1675]|uniref:efflux RND transporter periplasmic adaptor subunit n=1 Tax=Algoriphagus sp. CAU 1675 TaxID=3032597 RepID=UPI0023DC7AB7|nr:efflux RND transporter periplasmic adaptor subunit [Algoriphagus sp. CAU 1675]MDF2158656.1 efflux RND transporter periplasmic adaptor subunit [Algoriphagus sp. CAU 1675]